jgi:opacity protein-like surface antigen
MKKLILATLAFLSFNAATLQSDNFYVSAFGGGLWIQDCEKHIDFTYNVGYTYGGSLGYRWGCSGWRVEAEFAYRNNRIKEIETRFFQYKTKSHQSYYTGMGNIIYDFCIPTSYVHPFVGVGAGWYQQRITFLHNTFKTDDIGWQVLVGLSYEVNCCYTVDLTYCMFKPKDDFYTHNARLGVGYHF